MAPMRKPPSRRSGNWLRSRMSRSRVPRVPDAAQRANSAYSIFPDGRRDTLLIRDRRTKIASFAVPVLQRTNALVHDAPRPVRHLDGGVTFVPVAVCGRKGFRENHIRRIRPKIGRL